MVRLFVLGIVATLFAIESADARRFGRFVSGMARGAIQGGAEAGVRSYVTKSYGPDVLTVDQLVSCLKRAGSLDEESEQLEAKRTSLQDAQKDLDAFAERVERKRRTTDTRSQRQVDSFNSDVDAYNASVRRVKAQREEFNRQVDAHNSSASMFNMSCAKKYYADDMERARVLAGL
ncbi:MAG: hypothetical protein K2Z80_31270 [Xanthobacteraceae bacterium]|nr:hypothetical protein [Xanthobacteraceae bacterium]